MANLAAAASFTYHVTAAAAAAAAADESESLKEAHSRKGKDKQGNDNLVVEHDK